MNPSTNARTLVKPRGQLRGTVRRARLIAALVVTVFALGVRVGEALQWEGRGSTGPSPRAEYGFAFDTNRDVAVLFGGSSTLSFTAVNRETWEWNGMAWSLVNMGGPSSRCDNAMAFDSNRNRVVSFGGYRGTYLADTWEWDGATWDTVAVPGPSPRADAFMVFDSARGVMVLFGGQSSTGQILRETWEYDGAAWTLRGTGSPSARWIQRMAFDSDRGVTVLFGGANTGGVLGDTWEWDGTAWEQIAAAGPVARYGHAMAFDAARHVTVLFGGQTGFNFGVGPLGDTWEYNGIAWTQMPVVGPHERTFVKMVYDSARDRMVLFGGYNGTHMVRDTWELAEPATDVRAVGDMGDAGPALLPGLSQNAPNPFRDRTAIAYRAPSAGAMRLAIYDAQGEFVRDLVDDVETPGSHAVVWDGRDHRGRHVPSGVYLYRLVAGRHVVGKRMVLVR